MKVPNPPDSEKDTAEAKGVHCEVEYEEDFRIKKDMTAEEYMNKILVSELNKRCPVRTTLELLNGKWRTYVFLNYAKNYHADLKN